MRLLVMLLTIILSQTTFGQVVNSVSADKTGMFYYSVDTLIQTIKKEGKIKRIILRADLSTIQDFPEILRDIKIVKEAKIQEYKTKGLRDGDVVFRIKGLTIIRDQVTLSIGVYEKGDKGLAFFRDGVYIFYFMYLPESETYELTRIKSGIKL